MTFMTSRPGRTSPVVGLAWVVALVASGGGCHDHDGLEDLGAPVVVDLALALDVDAAPPVELGTSGGHIDPDGGGGDVSLLSFAVFGDVRPPLPDDSVQYPTATINAIFQGIAAQHPQFVIGTGDYMFVELLASSANAQIALLKTAEASFLGPIFHALGNHECNSFSDLNCPNLNESPNISAFLKQLVAFTPVPWYSFVVHTALGDAKFLFIAANAWNDAQAAWLTEAIAVPTRYTFVIRHQPTPDAGKPSTAAGIAGSNAILAGHPVTLYLYGHVHEYNHLTVNAVVTGNAGAPLDAGNYGWITVTQAPDATITVKAYQLASGLPVDAWAVTPAGAQAP